MFHGQFVVQVVPDASASELAAEYRMVQEFSYPNLSNVNLWDASSSDKLGGRPPTPLRDPERFAAQLRRDPLVVDAYPVY